MTKKNQSPTIQIKQTIYGNLSSGKTIGLYSPARWFVCKPKEEPVIEMTETSKGKFDIKE